MSDVWRLIGSTGGSNILLYSSGKVCIRLTIHVSMTLCYRSATPTHTLAHADAAVNYKKSYRICRTINCYAQIISCSRLAIGTIWELQT